MTLWVSAAPITSVQVIEEAMALFGLLAMQDGVGWTRPFYRERKEATLRDSNAVQVRIGRPFTAEEHAAFNKALRNELAARGVTVTDDTQFIVGYNEGARVVNGTSLDPVIAPAIKHEDFRAAVEAAVGQLTIQGGSLNAEIGYYESVGNLVWADWSNKDGQADNYVQKILGSRRSDLLRTVYRLYAPEANRIRRAFAKKYGWGERGTIPLRIEDYGKGEGVKAETPEVSPALVRRPGGNRPVAHMFSEQGQASRRKWIDDYEAISGDHRLLSIRLDKLESDGYLSPLSADLVRLVFSHTAVAPVFSVPAVKKHYVKPTISTTGPHYAAVTTIQQQAVNPLDANPYLYGAHGDQGPAVTLWVSAAPIPAPRKRTRAMANHPIRHRSLPSKPRGGNARDVTRLPAPP